MLCTRYRSSINLWQLILKSAGIDVVLDENFQQRSVNRSLSLDALAYLQELVQGLPEGAWSTSEGGANVGSELANSVGDIVARIDTARRHPLAFDKKTFELIEENFEKYFRGQINWMNTKFDIEGGPLLLGPWENATRSFESAHKGDHARRDLEKHFTRALLHDLGRFLFSPAQDKALQAQVTQVELIRKSGIFDNSFYRMEFMRLTRTGSLISDETAIVHFLKYGAAAGANPSPFFDVLWYQQANADLDVENPVLHYITHGAAEGRSPHPRIPPDVAKAFCETGNLVSLLNQARATLDAGSEREVSDELRAVLKLFEASSQTGRHLHQTISILNSGIFDARFYELERRRLGFPEEHLDPEALLIDFVTHGQDAGADPSPFFDVLWYRRNNPVLHTANPVLHYIAHGAAEGRSPHPRIPLLLAKVLCKTGNPVALLNQARGAVETGEHEKVSAELLAALKLFDGHDETEGQWHQATSILNSGIFDAGFYELERRRLGFPEEQLEPEALLIDFVTRGQDAGADPSPFFDTLWYKRVNADVHHTAPALHYVAFGAAEGRSPHPRIPAKLVKALGRSGNPVALLNQARTALKAGERGKISNEFLAVLRLFEWHDATEEQLQQAMLILGSGIFDARFYELERRRLGFPEGQLEPEALLIDFITRGRDAGANPSLFFDTFWYKQANVDLHNTDPTLHYIDFGAAEGRSPHPLIPSDFAQTFAQQQRPVSLVSILNLWHKRTIDKHTPQDLVKVLALFDTSSGGVV